MTERYDDSELALYSQVSVAEVDALLGDGARSPLRDSDRLMHFLTRVRSTLIAAHEAMAGMRRHIHEQQAHLARVGTATTLNPLDALRYLEDEQKEFIFDRIARERLKNLRTLVDRAQTDAAVVTQELESVRSVARGLAQMTDLPPHVRAEATRLLASLPRDTHQVHYPPILDYPEPEPLPAPAPSPAPDPRPSGTQPVFADPYAPNPSGPAQPTFVDPYQAAPADPTSDKGLR